MDFKGQLKWAQLNIDSSGATAEIQLTVSMYSGKRDHLMNLVSAAAQGKDVTLTVKDEEL